MLPIKASGFGVRALLVLWPAFLMASVLEGLVFAVVDPASLQGFGGAPLALSALAVYTGVFFVFWLVIAAACGLTQWLGQTADSVNHWPGRGR